MFKMINQLLPVCFTGLALILSGCGSAPPGQSEPVAAEAQAVELATPTAAPTVTPTPTSTSLPTEIIEEPVSPVEPAQGDAMPDTLPNLPPGSESAVKAAIEDLSSLQNIAAAEISVQSVEATDWSDSSLGCPQEGFMYAQVITPGYLILLEAGGETHEYHTNQTGDSVVLCKE
jgi:hypothetical protein